MQTILITGGSGFIGKNIISSLAKEYNFIALIRSTTEQNFFITHSVPIVIYKKTEDLMNIHSLLGGKKVDGIIHLAATYFVDHSVTQIYDMFYSNILLGTYLAEYAVHNGVKWFINTGTFFQYANSETYNPFNLYAATKQAFEDIIKYYINKGLTSFLTLYLHDTYGTPDSRRKLLNILKEISSTDSSIDLSPGEQLINILHINDVVSGYRISINLLETDPKLYSGKSYALSAKKELSLKDLVSLYEQLLGKKLHINRGKKGYRDNEIMRPWKGCTILPGREQTIDIEQGLQQFIFS